MKRIQKLSLSFALGGLLFLLNSCYTSFHTVKRVSWAGDEYAVEEAAYIDYDDNQWDEYDSPVTVKTELRFMPSRLVVKETYFDYGH